MNTEYYMGKCVETLKRATKIASRNSDADSLMAIFDRWYALMEHSYGDDKHPVGFTVQESTNDSSKASNKRKS